MKIFLISVFFSSFALCQSLLGEYAQNSNFPVQERLSTEKILKISNTKRVFILSYEEKGFLPGDYVTLILGDKHVARAVAAKVSPDQRAGLKVIKIYDLNLWNTFKDGMEVQVLRGDDSYYISQQGQQGDPNDVAQQEINRISSEDDLFNDTTYLEGDADIDEKSGRLIKTDNIITGAIGFIDTVDLNGSATSDSHFNFSWMYQFHANIWGSVRYGYTVLDGFPTNEVSTTMTTLTFKGYYTFKAPFYSFVLPYIGYRTTTTDSPAAEGTDAINEATQASLLSQIEESGPVAGVTILKRMVPGWFARLDLGTDLINIGASVEF